jgi:hypothetical protein
LVKKNSWRDDSGVSEVVGSILILLMTVALFSGIILWVWSMPTPDAIPKIDVGAEFNPIDYDLNEPPTWDIVYVNLTHRGGEELAREVIELYLMVNGSVEVLRTEGISGQGAPYGLTGSDEHWSIGETWGYRNYSMEHYHQIKITLVDRFSNVILWEKNLWGYEGAHPPIFTDKWTDGNPNSESRDLVQDNMTNIYTEVPIPFGVFAQIGDLDNDLNENSVFVEFTFGPLAGNSYRMFDDGSAAMCDDVQNDNIFSVCHNEFWPSSDWLQWDGGILLLNASDAEGRETTTRLVLHVYNYGDSINYEIFPGGGESGGIPRTIWDYIGFIQLDIDDIYWTHAGQWDQSNPCETDPPYNNCPDHFHPIYRINDKHIQKDYNGTKAMVWHVVMNNHGNRTIFLDAYSTVRWQEGTSSKWRHIIANDTGPYPHTDGAGQEGDIFQFNYDPDYIMDINQVSQEQGSMQLDIKFGSMKIGDSDYGDAGSTGTGNNPHPLFLSMSGILGPVNKTMQDISDHYCGGGPITLSCYNPVDYVDNTDEWQTRWFGQLIPFLSIWVFAQGGAGSDDNPYYSWPPLQPPWYG